MFSSTGTRSDSGSGRARLQTLRPTVRWSSSSAVMEIDAERVLVREALDRADIARRRRRRIGFVEAVRKRLAVALKQRARLARRMAQAPARRHSPSVQVRTMARDLALERGALDRGAVPPERPMMKCTRTSGPSREERIEGRHAADEGARQIFADLHADVAVVALARHVDQHRDETVEAVVPRQHAHARPLVELHDREREVDRACPRRPGTARRADNARARWPAPCRNGWPDRSRRAARPRAILRRR